MSEPSRPPATPDLNEPRPTRPTLRPIPRWVVAIGVPVMVLIAVAAVWLLLGFGLDRDRLDAIRTGGTLGVGLGGVVVLWLAVRRQRSTELDLLQKYETHVLAERIAAHNEQVAADSRAHQLRVAEDARQDAAERRITELYAKAVEQLGSEKAPVRLGGLYALERLAQNNMGQRQTIVNVLCAYLRMPYTLPENELPDDASTETRAVHEQGVQERQVRLAAQRILITHLQPGSNPDCPDETFWAKVDLDLTGAVLTDFTLRDCLVNNAVFYRARFAGYCHFVGSQFLEGVKFNGAHFTKGVDFSGTRFAERVEFSGAKFAEYAAFQGTRFTGGGEFIETQFTGTVWFKNAHFTGGAIFQNAQFAGSVGFENARFDQGAWFAAAQFKTEVPPEVAVFIIDADQVQVEGLHLVREFKLAPTETD